MKIGGKGIKVRVIMVYRPNRKGNQSGVYLQHERYLESKNDSREPLEAFNKDLEKIIEDHQNEGKTIILMGDFNIDVRRGKVKKMAEGRNMREVITI